MVRLEERVDGELPVDRALGLVTRERDVVTEVERGELALGALQVPIDVDRLAAARADEDHAVPLPHGQAGERELVARETRESLGARLADEAAVLVVGPAVIRADE